MYQGVGYTPADTAWLNTEYSSILGYPGDAAGLDYWGKQIDVSGRPAVHQSFLDVAKQAAVVKNGSGGAAVVDAPVSDSFIPGVPDLYLFGGLGLVGALLVFKKH